MTIPMKFSNLKNKRQNRLFTQFRVSLYSKEYFSTYLYYIDYEKIHFRFDGN